MTPNHMELNDVATGSQEDFKSLHFQTMAVSRGEVHLPDPSRLGPHMDHMILRNVC